MALSGQTGVHWPDLCRLVLAASLDRVHWSVFEDETEGC